MASEAQYIIHNIVLRSYALKYFLNIMFFGLASLWRMCLHDQSPIPFFAERIVDLLEVERSLSFTDEVRREMRQDVVWCSHQAAMSPQVYAIYPVIHELDKPAAPSPHTWT